MSASETDGYESMRELTIGELDALCNGYAPLNPNARVVVSAGRVYVMGDGDE